MSAAIRPSPLAPALALRRFVRCRSCIAGKPLRKQLSGLTAAVEDPWSALGRNNRIVDVSGLADQMRQEVRDYTGQLQLQQRRPIRLAGIFATQAMTESQRVEAEVYATHISQTLQEDGLAYEHVECRGSQPADVDAAIQKMNQRSDVHGILVYYPIFKNMRHQHNRPRQYLNASTGVYYKSCDDYLRDRVHPAKDVEGLGHGYNSRYHFRARARRGDHSNIYVPCTALAVARILETYHPLEHHPNGNAWKDVTVTVVNRSEIFGRPLAAMLALKGAHVFSVDENSILKFCPNGRMKRLSHLDHHQHPQAVSLEWCLQQSNIAVTGVPSPQFSLPLDALLAEKSSSSDTAVTIVNVSEFDNVMEEDVLERPDDDNITFIPSVGKVTVAALEHNLLNLHKQQQQQPHY
ncbi:Methylenetetrahydrofolate dehydrogenase [NAD(+)] [Seminavis robusta]|uniref:Methylenetetrahydrofolate dehydrogenase [NAD(+)] n=1 Tax=Seminavis robusta TaxID=568900 RepID=A0A9N8HBW9_9STRA|nr:Methylenetetrahydrofolate dehydrogenase [NAD(+)] [Seminavis robusta]|eukprot:Sro295_g110410.1 Methylenetetrahydrofolate dehydrogenase [NAD(+)] (407) ;mRNA; r:23868-25088